MNQYFKKMKNFIKLLSIVAIAMLSVTACKTGDTGPAGPAGANGEDGIDGASGTAGCVQCHTSDEDMAVKSEQWSVSGHVTGGHMMGFYGSRDGCADCHSSQGFQEVVATGEWDNDAPASPLPANCYTCHNIHQEYDESDWGFTIGDGGVEFLVTGEVNDMGNSNTCIQCHQSRTAEPVLDLATTDDVTITNKRYGPHHGPQGNMQAGVGSSGAYELDGTAAYANSMHATSDASSCTSCHMASQAGSGGNIALGEHSFNIGTGEWDDESRTINGNGCIACHGNITDNASATEFVAGARTANNLLLEDLRAALYALGYLDDDGYVATGNVTVSSDNPLVTSTQHAAAIYNYKFLVEDQSALIHNPMYAKALLQNSLEAVE